MKLSDQIINAGPYVAGDPLPEDTHVFKHPDGRVLLMIRIDREGA